MQSRSLRTQSAARQVGGAESWCLERDAGMTLETRTKTRVNYFIRELRHQRDRRLPERALRAGRIEHRDLAVVFAGRKRIQTDREAQRHGLDRVWHGARHLHRLRLEDLGLALVKAYESDPR